jgi:hypothetical protein
MGMLEWRLAHSVGVCGGKVELEEESNSFAFDVMNSQLGGLVFNDAQLHDLDVMFGVRPPPPFIATHHSITLPSRVCALCPNRPHE